MIRRLTLATAAVLFFLCNPIQSSADDILVEASFRATGSLGGVQFTDTFMRISGLGQTENVQENNGIFLLFEDFVVSVKVDGVGQAEFVDEIQAVSNNNTELGGFGNISTGAGLLFVQDPIFATYDLQKDLAPVTGTGLVSSFNNNTTMGNLNIQTLTSEAEVIATIIVVPEPGSSILFVLATGTLLRRRRT